jgi:hypothetical protein
MNLKNRKIDGARSSRKKHLKNLEKFGDSFFTLKYNKKKLEQNPGWGAPKLADNWRFRSYIYIYIVT